MTKRRRDLEGEFAFLIKIHGLPEPERQYRFAAHYVGLGPGIRSRFKAANLRDWRFDFAWPDIMLAVEIEGGIYTNGRHVRPKGFEDDVRKYNRAVLLGWTLIRFTAGMIDSGDALRVLRQAIAYKQRGVR